MSLVAELKKRLEATEDDEQRSKREAAASHARRLSDLASRPPDHSVLGLTPMFAKMLAFSVLRSFCAPECKGAFVHTVSRSHGALDVEDDSVYDGLDFLAGELRIDAERVRAHGAERLGGPPARALASLLARAFVEAVLEQYAARSAQKTVVHHALSHVHGSEAEVVLDPAEKLREEMRFHSFEGWREPSDAYLVAALGLEGREQLAGRVEAMRGLLADLRGFGEGHAGGAPRRERRASSVAALPSVRAQFLLLRGSPGEGAPVRPADGVEWPVDVHPTDGPLGDDAAEELARDAVRRDHEGTSPFVPWVRPKFRAHYCDGGAACAVPHAVRLGRRLGSGTTAVVFEAEWRGVRCAVKVFMDDLVADEAGSDRFLDELTIANRCHHPNTLGLLGAAIRPPNYAMVLPLARHGTLYDMLQAGSPRLSVAGALRVALGIARGMRYLHCTLHLLHRDVKSLNVLVDAAEAAGAAPADPDAEGLVPMVCDFGLAVFVRPNESLRDGLVVGTPVYQAPEIYRRQPYSFPADVFSFGVLLAEILTGRAPYAREIDEAGGYEEVVARVAAGDLRPDLGGAGGEAAAALVRDCTSADPHARPNFVAVAERLEGMAAAAAAAATVL